MAHACLSSSPANNTTGAVAVAGRFSTLQVCPLYSTGEQSVTHNAPCLRRRSLRAPNMADNCSSALLRCLQQLDDDAIAGVLLPKLVDAGAASNVTLTCKHLRELMQRNVSRLCFRSYSNGRKMEKLISTLPKRFPRCERVLLLYKGDSSYLFGQLLMPALAR